MKLWRVCCTKCGTLSEHRLVSMAVLRAERHDGKCKGSARVERVS